MPLTLDARVPGLRFLRQRMRANRRKAPENAKNTPGVRLERPELVHLGPLSSGIAFQPHTWARFRRIPRQKARFCAPDAGRRARSAHEGRFPQHPRHRGPGNPGHSCPRALPRQEIARSLHQSAVVRHFGAASRQCSRLSRLTTRGNDAAPCTLLAPESKTASKNVAQLHFGAENLRFSDASPVQPRSRSETAHERYRSPDNLGYGYLLNAGRFERVERTVPPPTPSNKQ